MTRPIPNLRGWTPQSVTRDGDVSVYTYTRDARVERPQRPTARRFGVIVREGYSDQGRTMTVRVQEMG